jgi:hypothetical protein
MTGARALLSDAQVQQNARELAAEFASLGGPVKAAEAVSVVAGG